MKRIIAQWLNPKVSGFESMVGDGNYIKDFEYSQGYFSIELTKDPIKAFDFTEKEHLFKTFFEHRGALLREIEIQIIWGANLS